jgi:hypothetical protein
MPDKHYIYDSEGRHALESKENDGQTLWDYYVTNKDYFVGIAEQLYATLCPPGGPAPLIGDVFVVVFGAMKSNTQLHSTLVEYGVNLERAANKWYSYFAWIIVLENWDDISAATP